ncbi:MAG TPA: YkgJ family cysteine cluster protein [archaeon]|nr:YkgJ family cysteine cluster protein [archaeon]
MKVNCVSLNCSECCRKYWITILPTELKKAAKLMRLGEKSFIEKYCVLHLNLFPAHNADSGLGVSSVFLPKKIAQKIRAQTGGLHSHYILLPSIAFKREKSACTFLSRNMCRIYSARPRQCALFPFISIAQKNLPREYPFCKALSQRNARIPKDLLEKTQLLDISSYFKSVSKKGFGKIWKFLPKKGVVCLENNFLCGISKKDFLELVSMAKISV